MENGERTYLPGHRNVTAVWALAAALALVLGSSTTAPILGATSPEAALVVTQPSSSTMAARLLATRQHAPVLIGELLEHDTNTLIRLLNSLKRPVDVELRFTRSGETTPTHVLRRILARRELEMVNGRREIGGNFRGAVTISSDRPIAAIVNLIADGGPRSSVVPYNNAHLGGSSILTELRHGKGFRTLRGIFNEDDLQVLVSQFMNNSGNQSVGGRVDTLLAARGNSLQLINELFPVKPGTKQPATQFNGVPANRNVAAGAVILDETTGDTYINSAIFRHIMGQRIVLPHISGGSTITVQDHGAANVAALLRAHTGAAEFSETRFDLEPNEIHIIDNFIGGDVQGKDNLPWFEIYGNGLRGPADAFLSAVLISDQTPAGRSADTNPGASRVKSGRFHTLVPSWTEEYAANKRAVAMVATLSDGSSVTFYALNVGPETARVKAVVRNGDGNRVFSKAVTVDPDQQIAIPFPSRLASRGQVEDLYVDAKISRSGPVFTHLLEEFDTGEVNYIPGIAVK